MSELSEVVEGVLHWSAPHPRIGQTVHSYFAADARAAIDPIGSDGLVEALAERGGVERVLLSNRHHLRASRELRERFGCTIHCPESGMHEFGAETEGVEPYAWGEELAPGVTAHEVGAICPDDGALHIAAGPGALVLADSIVRFGDQTGFVPDFLMDDPEQVKRDTVAALQRLLGLDFEALLLAHGEPIAPGGKAALERLVADPAQVDFPA